jgi:hypothetical protein
VLRLAVLLHGIVGSISLLGFSDKADANLGKVSSYYYVDLRPIWESQIGSNLKRLTHNHQG